MIAKIVAGTWQLLEAAAAIFLAIVAISVFLMVFNVTTASGKIESCEVRLYNGSSHVGRVYIVDGYIPWREDYIVAIADTAEEAQAKKELLCPR